MKLVSVQLERVVLQRNHWLDLHLERTLHWKMICTLHVRFEIDKLYQEGVSEFDRFVSSKDWKVLISDSIVK